MSSAAEAHTRHLVVPGQVIAISSEESDGAGFLRGHGTYIETLSVERSSWDVSSNRRTMENDREPSEEDEQDSPAVTTSNQRLVASVAGIVERVNKLISVIPIASPAVYTGQVGDLVIGRISGVGATRWKVSLDDSGKSAALPLSGVNLPGGAQRIRTAQDALSMRSVFREGDLLSAEVQSVQQQDGSLLLHTRTLRYGKLENGCFVSVLPALIRRMKQHFCTLEGLGVDVLLGINGGIWIQRSIPKEWNSINKIGDEEAEEAPLAETLQRLKARHATTMVLPDERAMIARVRNAIEALGMVYCFVTPENICKVVSTSIDNEGGNFVNVADMLKPEVIVQITACTRI